MSDAVNFPDKWETDYERGTDGWDQGGPTPIFQRLAASKQFKPGRMIVLGAGRGHDAREFARYGHQVTAVDFAAYAVREMHRLSNPAAPINAMQHDLFRLPRELDGQFDTVLEYTCFCAIDPKRRSEYADIVARLLKPQGLYIDLAFPLGQRVGGPPFTVSIDEVIDLFTARKFTLIQRETPIDSVKPRAGQEELLIFQANHAPTVYRSI